MSDSPYMPPEDILALLEYNDHYWRSHPAIRTTETYRNARDLIKEAGHG